MSNSMKPNRFVSSSDTDEELTIQQLDDEDDFTKEIQTKLNSQTLDDLEDELSQFRLEWKQELLQQQENERNRPVASAALSQQDSYSDDLHVQNEKKAAYLFNKGILLEQQGRLYEAIKFYRMAMQLDADIEIKLASNRNIGRPQLPLKQAKVFTESNEFTHDDEENLDLYERFQLLIQQNDNQLCERQFATQQKHTHFSDLPFEVVIYILRWVVSKDLDLRSLENVSTVCRGFYVCARDPEIWKTACEKIWRNNIGNGLSYDTWRNMYLSRPRLNFDGCYISKATYIRAGEQSLDSFYRPWHLVEYFRYLRFFSDGSVLMLTTPEEPKTSIIKLKSKQTRDNAILSGHWTLNSNRVSILLMKKVLKYTQKANRRGKEISCNQEQFYNMEFELSHSGKKLNIQLSWISYELHIANKMTNTESTTAFEMNKVDFPPFYFSRVKSYASASDAPLL